MKTRLFALLACAAMFTFVSCSDNGLNPEQDNPFSKQGLITTFDSKIFDCNVAYLGGVDVADEPWIRARAAKRLVESPEDADVIILGGSMLSSCLDQISEAYDEGKFIIVGSPDLDYLAECVKDFGWDFILPTDKPQGKFCFGFSERASFLLNAPVDVTDVDNPVLVSEASAFHGMQPMIQFINQLKEKRGTKSSSAGPLNVAMHEYGCGDSQRKNISCCVNGGTTFYFTVFHSNSVKYLIYSCYAPENTSQHGDYYSVQAYISNFPSKMYQTDEKFSEKPKESATFFYKVMLTSKAGVTGPYHSKVESKFYAVPANSLVFYADGNPLPQSKIETTSYSQTQGIDWSVGISGGYSEGDGFNIGMNLGVGGSASNTVKYEVSDLSIQNNHDDNVACWDFTTGNIPPEETTSASVWDDFTNIPAIAQGTEDLSMSWIWKSSQKGMKKDYDTLSIPFKSDAVFYDQIIMKDRNGGKWAGRVWTVDYPSVLNHYLSVVRIPVGCLQIVNQSSKEYMYNVCVYDASNKNSLVCKLNNSIGFGNEFQEVLLPQANHSYFVTCDRGTKSSATVPYRSSELINLPLLVSHSNDVRKIYMGDEGGDFSQLTSYGLLIINNVSLSGLLIRNLTVYQISDSGDKVVYFRENSISNIENVEIKLDDGFTYYVEIELGSATRFKAYRTETDFVLKKYDVSDDAKVLNVTDDGGDFVLM